MTIYTAIANSQIDAESYFDTVLAAQYRDNPIAITEGASGAPAVMGAAINKTYSETTQAIGATSSFTPTAKVAQYATLNYAVSRTELYFSAGWHYAAYTSCALTIFDGMNQRIYSAAGSGDTIYFEDY